MWTYPRVMFHRRMWGNVAFLSLQGDVFCWPASPLPGAGACLPLTPSWPPNRHRRLWMLSRWYCWPNGNTASSESLWQRQEDFRETPKPQASSTWQEKMEGPSRGLFICPGFRRCLGMGEDQATARWQCLGLGSPSAGEAWAISAAPAVLQPLSRESEAGDLPVSLWPSSPLQENSAGEAVLPAGGTGSEKLREVHSWSHLIGAPPAFPAASSRSRAVNLQSTQIPFIMSGRGSTGLMRKPRGSWCQQLWVCLCPSSSYAIWPPAAHDSLTRLIYFLCSGNVAAYTLADTLMGFLAF